MINEQLRNGLRNAVIAKLINHKHSLEDIAKLMVRVRDNTKAPNSRNLVFMPKAFAVVFAGEIDDLFGELRPDYHFIQICVALSSWQSFKWDWLEAGVAGFELDPDPPPLVTF